MYLYIYIYIYIYILKRLPPLPPTSTHTRCLDDETIYAYTDFTQAWMLGCLSFCLPGGRIGTNSSEILEAFDHLRCLLQGPGAIWAPLEQLEFSNELLGAPVRAVALI